jgi:DNA invertase Pin-like site-specific DNA recombinase
VGYRVAFGGPSEQRPAFDALHKAAVRREFDVVMAWSVDRLGRSLQDLIGFPSEIHAAGVDLFLYQQGLDTTKGNISDDGGCSRSSNGR